MDRHSRELVFLPPVIVFEEYREEHCGVQREHNKQEPARVRSWKEVREAPPRMIKKKANDFVSLLLFFSSLDFISRVTNSNLIYSCQAVFAQSAGRE